MSNTNLRMSRAPWIPGDRRSSFDALFKGAGHRIESRGAMPRDALDPRDVAVLTSGLAMRVRYLQDGRRHVTRILVPGDTCDFGFLHGVSSDTTLVAVSTCTFATATPLDLQVVPGAFRALWWEAATEHRAQVDWATTLAARNAVERVCHMYHDVSGRLDAVGLVHEGSFVFPLTQDEVADHTGMTAIHVNRVIKGLRERDLVRQAARVVTIPDRGLLACAASLDVPRGARHLRPDGRRRATRPDHLEAPAGLAAP